MRLSFLSRGGRKRRAACNGGGETGCRRFKGVAPRLQFNRARGKKKKTEELDRRRDAPLVFFFMSFSFILSALKVEPGMLLPPGQHLLGEQDLDEEAEEAERAASALT